MGSKERKEKERLIKKNDIIDAAEKVFFEKGIKQATMDEVAKTAEFSKRTIYVYFESKEHLYHEIMLRAFKTLDAMITESFEKRLPTNGINRIKLLGQTLIEFIKNYPKYFKAIVDYENQENDFYSRNQTIIDCYQEGEKSFSHLKDAIQEGINDGSITTDVDVTTTAIILWTNMIGIFNIISKKEKYLQRYHQCDTSSLVDEAIRFMIRSIKNRSID